MSTKHKAVSVLIVAFLAALMVRTFFVETFVVLGDSMVPAIQNGQYVLINKLAYAFGKEPERGDIIVVSPRGGGQRILKRVVGLPGERISIEEGRLVLRTDRLDEGEMLAEEYLQSPLTSEGETFSNGITLIKLDPQEYFALGDNRAVSVDSRELGPVDHWSIKGQVFGTFDIKTFKFSNF